MNYQIIKINSGRREVVFVGELSKANARIYQLRSSQRRNARAIYRLEPTTETNKYVKEHKHRSH